MTAHTPSIRYGKQDVDGINIFYREAGSTTSPAVLLMHGFPSSSHMFRGLIPPLARHFHVIAPDLPGFGFSDAPSRSHFVYTFDHLTDVMERFTEAIGLARYALYIFDYGAPVGLRLALRHPRTDHGHRVPKRERVRGRSQRRLESDSTVLGNTQR